MLRGPKAAPNLLAARSWREGDEGLAPSRVSPASGDQGHTSTTCVHPTAIPNGEFCCRGGRKGWEGDGRERGKKGRRGQGAGDKGAGAERGRRRLCFTAARATWRLGRVAKAELRAIPSERPGTSPGKTDG